jgi:serine/threonine protein kinase
MTRSKNPPLHRQNSLHDNKILLSSLENSDETEISFSRDFDEEGEIGHGTSANVYLVRDKRTNKKYAIKRIKNPLKSKKERKLYMNEVELMKCLGPCEYIVHFIRAWQEGGHFYAQVLAGDFLNPFVTVSIESIQNSVLKL